MAESQPDLFVAESQDDRILRLHREGVLCREIGLALGLPEMRVIHELNRILNALTEGVRFDEFREAYYG